MSKPLFSTLVFSGLTLWGAAALAEETPVTSVTPVTSTTNSTPPADSATAVAARPLGFYLEYAKYRDNVYSQSKKTELGDQTRLEMAFRYQRDENTFGRFRFETDPLDNRLDNKTSKFELLAGHRIDNFEVQIDSELNGNDGGGTSVGLDLDSKYTFLRYTDGEFAWTFFPFNFNGEVGKEFNTYDVTRIYSINGSPTTVNNTPLGSETISEKTIPGVEVRYSPNANFNIYLGAGVATFLYPTNPAFNIQSSRTADRWERREDVGYKFGAAYSYERTTASLQYVGHGQSQYTGSLLESAGSLLVTTYFGDYMVDAEYTMSKAGKAPYRLSRTSSWFEQTSPFQPVYSDYYGVAQDWLGKTDSAVALKFGYKVNDTFLPYIFYRYQGQYFVFRERESAHTLRTADETKSHGGLNRAGLGLYKVYGNFTVNPELEWLKARNPVFSNSSDVRADRVLASFREEDYLMRLTVTYNFDGQKSIR